MAKKKVYLGQVEFQFTQRDIESIMKEIVKNELRYTERRLGEYPRAIRALQRKVLTMENKIATLEIKANGRQG